MPNPPTQVLSVTELTRRIKGLLERNFAGVWVEGEISNLRIPSSGHVYFTLKDAHAQLAAVLFRGAATRVGFKLKDGLQVIAYGDISVYEKQGQYQIVVTELLPKGLGALQLAFEQLKNRLQQQGLFAQKRPIPMLPRRIGVVTSPTGAAIRDFLRILERRFPNVHIVIAPVRVQGEGAAAEIAAAIELFNTLHAAGKLRLDVLVVTRGGGSLEDLWAFNEEIVARALFRSKIPTISAVGHEIDFTISDFVADLRAPTPSAAAELVVKAREEFSRTLREYEKRLEKDLRLRVAALRQRYSELAFSYVFRQPAELIRQYQQQIDDLAHRLAQSTKWLLLERWRQRLESQSHRIETALNRCWQNCVHRYQQARGKLQLLSPNATLSRGYSITRIADTGAIVRSIRAVEKGTAISTTVLDGEFGSVVSSEPKPR